MNGFRKTFGDDVLQGFLVEGLRPAALLRSFVRLQKDCVHIIPGFGL